MEHRGRKSAAELTVIGRSGIVTIQRPDPPAQLTDVQAEVWRVVVNRLPADWFPPETHGELTSYCEHTAYCRYLAEQISNAQMGNDVDLLDKLMKMHERATRAASSLATRMRLTQQSTFSDKRKKPALTLPKPWEDK